jgi:murein L,D-transpeptidase YafK
MRLLAVAIASTFVVACAVAPPSPGPRVEPPAEVSPPAPRPGVPPCERILGIEVRKAERLLIARCEGGAAVRFRIALGREPRGPKTRLGDLRTPEGEYRISGPARGSRFHLFIPIDYPSTADARRALELGILSAELYREIVRAIETGSLLPPDSPLGGGLGLHGEGGRWSGKSEFLDWTNGCIALGDEEIEFLAERLPVGTPVLVLP